MIRPTTVARARALVAGLLLASVAWGSGAQPADTTVSPRAGEPPALALVLPSQQSVFGQVAEAVRLGFFSANEAAGRKFAIQVVEADDATQLRAAIGSAAQRGVKAVVGPLLRDGVNAVVDGLAEPIPLIALNYPDRDAGLPPTMIALALSAEAEAQYVVRVALAEFVGTRRSPGSAPRFVVVAGQSALERRIANAYVAALREEGEPPLAIYPGTDVPFAGLGGRFDPARHDAVFLALDAGQAALLRAHIPRPILIFGTSLLNATGGAVSPEATALAHDLDGVRFVDMPWLLRAGASMGAQGPLPPAPMPPELARLYALGADAYQVALRWSAGERQFTVDGMMGRLRVDRSVGARVERTPAAAVFRNGAIEREEIGR